MKSPSKYALLKGLLTANSMNYAYLALTLKRSLAYVRVRMCGKASWEAGEMYAIMDMFRLPHNKLHEYFPPGGDPAKLKIEEDNSAADTYARLLEGMAKTLRKEAAS